MYCYLLYGLSISSSIPLPGLRRGGGGNDVSVQQGSFELPQSLARGPAFGFAAEQDSAYLKCPLGSFRVRAGTEVVAMPVPGAAPEFLARFISGHVSAILYYQRGVPALHASAVAVRGRAVAFVGGATVGKSPVASALVSRGHPLVSDDLLPLHLVDGRALAYPGPPSMKLWPDTVRALGGDPDGMPSAWPEGEKRHRAVGRVARGPLPLARVYLLRRADDHAIAPISGGEAVYALARHTYDSGLLHALDEARFFRQSTGLFRATPVYRLQRAMALDLLPDLVQLLEEHLDGMGPVDRDSGAHGEHAAAVSQLGSGLPGS